jgi:hypothetical protein
MMRYKFSHRSDDGLTYYWISKRPIGATESRHEEIKCSVKWFWRKK